MHRITSKVDFLWRKRYRYLLFLVFVVGNFFIVFSDYIWPNLVGNFSAGDKLLGAIYFTTAIIIFWYTRETFDLKTIANKNLIESRKQTFLSVRPFIRLQWLDTYEIRIVNEGYGIALDVVLTFTQGGIVRRTIISGEKASKAYTDAGYEDVQERGDINDVSIFGSVYSPSKNNYEINVKYRDIVSNQYEQIFVTDARLNDRFRLIAWDVPEGFKPISLKRVNL